MIYIAYADLRIIKPYFKKYNVLEGLSKVDLLAYQSYLQENDRDHLLATRMLLHLLLERYFGRKITIANLSKGEFGEPFLPGLKGLSISHSGHFSFVALSNDCLVGIDVQEYLEIGISTVLSVLSKEEQQVYIAMDEREKKQFFFNIWTQKESVLKAMQSGFTVEPNRLNVLDDRVKLDDQIQNWYFNKTPQITDYSVSLVSDFHAEKVNWYQFGEEFLEN